MIISLDQKVFLVFRFADGGCGAEQSWVVAAHDVESDNPKSISLAAIYNYFSYSGHRCHGGLPHQSPSCTASQIVRMIC